MYVIQENAVPPIKWNSEATEPGSSSRRRIAAASHLAWPSYPDASQMLGIGESLSTEVSRMSQEKLMLVLLYIYRIE